MPTLTACYSQEDYYTLGNGSKVLTIAVRTGNIGFYAEETHPKGIDHDLLLLFAERTDRRLRIKLVASADQALTEVHKGNAAFAAGLLTLPRSQQSNLVGSDTYLMNHQEIVYRYDTPKLAGIEDIVMKNIDVTDNLAHLDNLAAIQTQNNDATQWHLNKNLSVQNLLKLTEQGFVDYAVMDSAEAQLFKLHYPSVNQSLRISEDMPFRWIMLKKDEDDLAAEIRQFFAQIRESGELANIIDRYYGHLEQIDYSEKLSFVEKFEQRLPTYQPVFMEVANTLNIDWRLIAAVSYQESLWNPKAQSPSGVIGMMMITREVADQFGVETRNEPVKNIIAGTQYLLELKRRLPETIAEPDRTWMALAAYNSGFSLLQKAIEMAEKKGFDPTLWVNIRKSLEQMKNGRNIIEYVYNIRGYLDLIAWLDNQTQPRDSKIRFKPVMPPLR